MYFKIFTFFAFLFINILNAQTENSPHIEYKRLTYESLQNHPCKVFSANIKGFEKHPLNILQMKNFPREEILTLSIKRPLFLEKSIKMYSFFLKETPEDSIYITSGYFLPGERIDLIITSKNGKFEYSTSFIPNPIRVKDKDGKIILTAELTIAKVSMEAYRIELFDIPEKELLIMRSVSGTEVLSNTFAYSKDIAIFTFPGVINKKGGIDKVTFKRESKEKIEVRLPWGTELYKYLPEDIANPNNNVFDPTE